MKLFDLLPIYNSILFTLISIVGLLGIKKQLMKIANEGYTAAVNGLKEQVEVQKGKITTLEGKIERMEIIMKSIHPQCITDGCLRQERIQNANNWT